MTENKKAAHAGGQTKILERLYLANSFSFFFVVLINSAGNNIRFVNVAATNVSDINQPNDFVPPNPLKQKITNPAINTSDV